MKKSRKGIQIKKMEHPTAYRQKYWKRNTINEKKNIIDISKNNRNGGG